MYKLIKFCMIGLSALGINILALATSTIAAPVLKDNITVISPIVTVGDMFDNAGLLAEQALFRAPAPGTVGQVSLQSIRVATAKVGINDFENPGFISINVARAGVVVDITTFEALIATDLKSRNIMQNAMSLTASLNGELGILFAQEGDTPVTLTNLRFIPANNQFSARFQLQGQRRPIDIAGRLDFSILTPHLVRALPVDSILSLDDIEMRAVPLQFATSGGVPMLEQLVGRQLLRNQLGGTALRLADIVEPTLITRNQIVTLFLKAGAMTLTVKGQALNDAAAGQTVSVLNLLSNTVVQGIANSAGTVEISATSTRVAAL